MKISIRKGQWDALAIAVVVVLVFSFAFGGASRVHALRLALVELAALPLLAIAGIHLQKWGSWREHKLILGLLAGLVAVPLIQLIPLPPAVWTVLPGRQQLTLALSLAGMEPGWTSLSVTPDRTWQHFLALIPPVAMFLAALMATYELTCRLIYVAIGATVVSILIGVLQISGSGVFYLWPDAYGGGVEGLFANRNHHATLLLAILPFAAAFAGASLRRRASGSQTTLWLWALFIGLVVVAIGVIRSRAGVILIGPSLALSLLAAWIASGRRRPGPAFFGMAAVVGLAIAAVGLFALAPILDRFDPNSPAEGRFENWPVVAEAAQTYLPVGSGLGSFDAVYRSVEPLERLDPTYFNQAHNDYLETWLETGWMGMALVLVFLAWWGRRSWACWRAPPSRESDLQRAASIAILMVLLHSVVDYPLRTETIAVLFALFAAILEGAGAPGESRIRQRTRRPREQT
ncbi:O-antigen ligase family protein [Brevundimonas sp.]|uniref:O-antigen ligase family protein n=1 Tax=Brevundimonas sp. TaxID=1871086 RepID=UPI003A93DF3B